MAESRDRLDRLRDDVAALRLRGGGRRRIERTLAIAGAVLIAVGLPLILLGWWGSSRTPYVFEQVPYLISGGVFGLALVVLGGFSYFAYWLTRQMQESRRASAELLDALDRIAASLAAAPAVAAASNGSYVATEKGTMFHRPGCAVVAGRTDTHRVAGRESGLEPCKICTPLAAPTS